MKITVFAGNQPRHVALINSLAGIADHVFVIQECTTVFPGQIKDFYDNSDVMNTYFQHVRQSERNVFGTIGFLRDNVSSLVIKDEDLNGLDREILEPALESDYYIVFGASYIKGWLIEHLIENRAVNIHMGVSPYYRGNSCNFWALYDKHPELVGATIHLLSKGLDAGDMLYHALPKAQAADPFDLGMIAVKVAQESLLKRIEDGTIYDFEPERQDKAGELRYTKNSDFNDAIAKEYLDNQMSPNEIFQRMRNRNIDMFKDLYVES